MPSVEVRSDKGREPDSLLVGCGGAGRNMVSASGWKRSVVADSAEGADIRVDRSAIALSQMDVSLIRAASPAFFSRLEAEAETADAILVVGGLGGFAGGVATSAVARSGKALGKPVIASVALPFVVEGVVRRASARKALERLESAANITVAFENNIINSTMANVRITRALEIMNRIVLSPLEELMQCSDREFIESLRGIRRRGIYAVSHMSGLDWEKKAAQSIVTELGDDGGRLKEVHLFLSMAGGFDDSPERLGNEAARLLHDCSVTVWPKTAHGRGQNRIGALGLF